VICRRYGFPTAGFTLLETMIATGIAGVIIGAFLTSTMAFQRAFNATEAYSTSKRDQMRLTDYLAMDLRRALTVQTVASGTTFLSLTIPNYYADNGTARLPTVNGLVADYGSPSVAVTYFKEGNSIYRREASNAAIELAANVEDFQITVEDLNKVIKTRINFIPKFRAAPGTASRESTTLHNTIWLRNKRRN